MSKKPCYIVLALLSGFYLTTNTAIADSMFKYDVNVSAMLDDNLNNSLISAEERDDTSYNAEFSISYSKRIGKNSTVSARGLGSYTHFSEFDGLNRGELGGEVTYRLKPYSGFNQPTYIFSGKITSQNFKTDIRDSTKLRINSMLSSWITDRASARAGLSYQINDSESRVYDTSDIRLFINADLLLTQKTTLYTTLDYITGDIVSVLSTANTSSEFLDIIDLAGDNELDPTFGDNEVAYRIDAETITFALGINTIIARKQSLDLFARTVSSTVDNNASYDRLIISLSYLARF